MMAAIVVTDDRALRTMGAMMQVIRNITEIKRFITIFTACQAMRAFTTQNSEAD